MAKIGVPEFNYAITLYFVFIKMLICFVHAGVTNGENNGLQLLLDAEVYDYAYKNRGGEGFKVRNISLDWIFEI